MDLSSKIPFQRDWENLSLFSRKEGEISKHAQQSDWEVVDNHGSYGNGNGSVYSSGGGLGPGSDLGNGSSRSSISSSIGFPSKAGTGALGFIIDLVEKPPEILKENKDLAMVETGILHRVVAVDGPKEPRTQLKLGKRTYFEGGIHITNSSSLASTNPSIGLVKKPKVSQQNMQSSHCQVEGCNVDLSAAKDYHRKHRVCESHSKSPKVIVAGQTCRFCQQCSRFHDLSEFDQKKRSCRRRLSDHNARRRKPQPGTIGLGSSVLSASYYDDRQRMNLIFGRAPFNHVAYMANSTWDDSGGFKLIPSQEPWINSGKSGDINGQLHFSSNQISKNVSRVNHEWDGLLPFKGTNAAATNKGPGAPVFASNLDGALDLQNALSLLSTESWVPYQEPISDFQSVNSNIITSHSAIHPTNAMAGSWQKTELLLPWTLPFNLQNNVNQI
ncbi:hypothetical protein BHM03_00037075 [Ensete ventricosum]|nr:hypothetical protein BHM03_00037075 [Ensete ventricosum]